MRRAMPIVVLAAAVLAGCGQSNPELIPQANADTLQSTADKIQAACDAKDRSTARSGVPNAQREIDALPRTVDEGLKKNLQEWVEQIQSRISRDCRDEEEASPTPTATES